MFPTYAYNLIRVHFVGPRYHNGSWFRKRNKTPSDQDFRQAALTRMSSRAALAPSCNATILSVGGKIPSALAFNRAPSKRAGNALYGWKTAKWKLSPCHKRDQSYEYTHNKEERCVGVRMKKVRYPFPTCVNGVLNPPYAKSSVTTRSQVGFVLFRTPRNPNNSLAASPTLSPVSAAHRGLWPSPRD